MLQMSRNTQSAPPMLVDPSDDPTHIVAAVTVCPDWFGFTSDTAVFHWLIATLQSQFPNIPIAPSACLELLSGFDARLTQTRIKVHGLLDYLVEKSGHDPAAVQVIVKETAVSDMIANFWTVVAICPTAKHGETLPNNRPFSA